MPNKRKKSDFAPQTSSEQAPLCASAGCAEPGQYKAPRSKDHLHDYVWYCLDHIREHNQKWDYFSGMEREEMEDFMKDAVTGHRPTWDREGHLRRPYEKLQDALHQFLHNKPRAKAAPVPPNAKLRHALHVLELDYPYTKRSLKTRYRALVKLHHPDLHEGDKLYEEKFKEVTASYQFLLKYLEKK